MPEFDPEVAEVLREYRRINDQLDALEGKTDPASCDRREDLFEELLFVDMSLGPVRKAMMNRGRGKEE